MIQYGERAAFRQADPGTGQRDVIRQTVSIGEQFCHACRECVPWHPARPGADRKLRRDLKTLAMFVEVYCRNRHEHAPRADARLTVPYQGAPADRTVRLCPACSKLLAHAFVKRARCPLEPETGLQTLSVALLSGAIPRGYPERHEMLGSKTCAIRGAGLPATSAILKKAVPPPTRLRSGQLDPD